MLLPVTVVKTRMEYSAADATIYRHPLHALASILKKDGPTGLFRGLAFTIFTNAPFSALYYSLYIKTKEQLKASGQPQVMVNLASGSVAAVAATFFTQPFDVLR
jgi:hypothetical protein